MTGHDTVAGGLGNQAYGGKSTIGGGVNNQARAFGCTVGGGGSNTVGGTTGQAQLDWYATVGGGDANQATANHATVPGGLSNLAAGSYSLAAGRQAKANHGGSFVWADSTGTDFASVQPDEFAVRAGNGVRLVAGNGNYGTLIDNRPAADGGDGLRVYARTSKGDNWGALYAVNEGTSPAVYAQNTGGGRAGYFAGDVTVTGTLSKGGGSFRIDHPLDPERKTLSHSFVESPDMMNVYNGNVVLDARGEASIELPAWFGALNRDFRYQLTAIGGPGPNLHVADEIKENRFRIAGGSPGLKVSWQVTGIRQDPYANAHRIQVEEDKPAAAVGTYLHPEAYGKPARATAQVK
jgi:hypothetical protein